MASDAVAVAGLSIAALGGALSLWNTVHVRRLDAARRRDELTPEIGAVVEFDYGAGEYVLRVSNDGPGDLSVVTVETVSGGAGWKVGEIEETSRNPKPSLAVGEIRLFHLDYSDPPNGGILRLRITCSNGGRNRWVVVREVDLPDLPRPPRYGSAPPG